MLLPPSANSASPLPPEAIWPMFSLPLQLCSPREQLCPHWRDDPILLLRPLVLTAARGEPGHFLIKPRRFRVIVEQQPWILLEHWGTHSIGRAELEKETWVYTVFLPSFLPLTVLSSLKKIPNTTQQMPGQKAEFPLCQ